MFWVGTDVFTLRQVWFSIHLLEVGKYQLKVLLGLFYFKYSLFKHTLFNILCNYRSNNVLIFLSLFSFQSFHNATRFLKS